VLVADISKEAEMTMTPFIEEENSEWIKITNPSHIDYPTIDFVVIKEEKTIGKQGIYTLKIKKVNSIHGPRYMGSIWSGGGSGCNTGLFVDYESALRVGKTKIEEIANQFEEEYERYKSQVVK